MKTHNKEAVEAAKRLSNLPKKRLLFLSKLFIPVSSLFVIVGGILLVIRKDLLGGGSILFGIISLITNGLNIARSKE